MERKFEVLDITEEDKTYFQKFYRKHDVVGFMKETTEDGETTVIIVKMKRGYKGWTPTGCVRDCGNHYIIARYSHYDMIDKKTMSITYDVEDK